MYPYRGHYGAWPARPGVFALLFMLVLVALAVAAIIALLRAGRARHDVPPAAPPRPPFPAADDAALREVRLRYARGELDREEFLAKLADLGGSPAASPPSPTT
jgi:putative membrane protein